MKFKRIYFFGGDTKANDDDWVHHYIADNGKRIDFECSISNQSARTYIVDGCYYDTLKEAKAACEEA